MLVFTTYFSTPIEPCYKECIDSLKIFYPELVIIIEPSEEAKYIASYQAKSDVTRIKILSDNEEALYFDSDIFLNKELIFKDISKPIFHGCCADLDICMIYHKGHQEFFKNLYKDILKRDYHKLFVPQNIIREKYMSKISLFERWHGIYKHQMFSLKGGRHDSAYISNPL